MKKKPIQYFCLQCGNEIFRNRNKDFVICRWCGYSNDIEELKEFHGVKRHKKFRSREQDYE